VGSCGSLQQSEQGRCEAFIGSSGQLQELLLDALPHEFSHACSGWSAELKADANPCRPLPARLQCVDKTPAEAIASSAQSMIDVIKAMH